MTSSWPYHHLAVRDRTFDSLNLTVKKFKAIKTHTPFATWLRLPKGEIMGVALEMLIEAIDLEDYHVIDAAIKKYQAR